MTDIVIRESIKKELKDKNITMYKLADDLKLDKSNVAHFLKGKTGMSIDKVEKICKYLKLNLKPLK